MNAYSWAWLGLGVAFVAIEALAIGTKNWAGTLSENIRQLFRVDTAKGKLAFSAVWLGFAVWFLGHILKVWP